MSLQNSHQISEIKVLLKKGADGAGIANIELTGQSLNVDTYTITLTNGDKYTFTVTNGSSIASIEKTGTSGNVDTYTITLTNGDTYPFTVTNATGSSADGITYDNNVSGLTATNVQDAIDEIVALITALSATDVSYDNSTSGLNATKVQGAIDEVVEMTKHGLYEVWKNTSPTSNFAGQTLHILTDKNIDIFIFEYIISTSNIIIVNPLFSCEVGGSVVQCSSLDWYNTSGSNYAVEKIYRQCSASITSSGYDIVVGDCSVQRLATYGGTLNITTNNARLIPYRILGIIHND